MTLCVIDGKQCRCQPDEGAPCTAGTPAQVQAALNAELMHLRAALEVSQAATAAAVSKAQWQARTNAELNALDSEVRRLRAEACRRLNDEFGA